MWLRDARNNRWTHDGWGIKLNGFLLEWTVSSTREECRQIIRDRVDLFGDGGDGKPPIEEQLLLWKQKVQIVKVKIAVTEVT